MSSSADISQRQLQQMSPYFDVHEFRCRSREANSDLFEDFIPATEVMSICSQLSRQRSICGSEEGRARLTLIPSVFGLDGSSPPHVASWGYKPIGFPKSKKSSKGSRVDAAKINRRDEWRYGEHTQKWGYSSPAFQCRSPPTQLYKLKNSQSKLKQNSPGRHCVVPGMNIQRAILFQRTFNSKFLVSNEEIRKHNNTPFCSLEAATLQGPLTKYASMPDLKPSMQTCHGEKERKEGAQYLLHKIAKNVSTRENLENSTVAAKCPLCSSESQELTKSFIQAKKIDIKLPCLENNLKT